MYTATLKVFGKTFTGSGNSVFEAIDALAPGNIKGKAILTLSRGKKTKERVLMPLATSRLFNTRGFAREINLKNTSLLFQGFDT